jgi:hypothetical protein
MSGKEFLFEPELLDRGKFPRLASNGKAECRNRIREYGFKKFLEKGWDELSNDTILKTYLETCIKSESEGKSARYQEKISRSFRYGGSLVYYPLKIQTVVDKGKSSMPIINREQFDSAMKTLSDDSLPTLTYFMIKYDENLAAVVGGALVGDVIISGLELDRKRFLLAMHNTYFLLAHKAEADGFNNIIG